MEKSNGKLLLLPIAKNETSFTVILLFSVKHFCKKCLILSGWIVTTVASRIYSKIKSQGQNSLIDKCFL